MFPKLHVRWLVLLLLGGAAHLFSAQAAHGDVWSLPPACECNNETPFSGWAMPSLEICLPRPCWTRPTPSYQSSWARVPVTNYRPQAVNDPYSGVSGTALQPCDTYEWQMRRTPGCALWHSFADWWRSNCCLLHRPSVPPAPTTCTPTSQWAVTSPESTESPYYAPATNGRLVPVPSSAAPTSPVPADRRPQLDPVPPRAIREGSASRLFPPDTEVFVQTLDDSDTMLEFGPPLVAPLSQVADASVADDQATSGDETSLELIPVSLSIATPSYESKLPTDEVWDDTGWRTEQ